MTDTSSKPATDARPRGFVIASIAFRCGIATAVLAIAVLIFMVLLGSRREIDRDEAAASLPVVQSVVARERAVPRSWRGYGTARAMDVADVAAEVAGRVVDRPLKMEPGRPVRAGEVLLEIDKVDYGEALVAAQQRAASLEAQLAGVDVDEQRVNDQIELASEERNAAQRDYDRVVEAVQRGAGNASEVDRFLTALRASERALSGLQQQLDLIPSRRASLNAQLAGARADRRIAEENVARASITSPIDGVLQSIEPERGERVNIGEPVARVVSLARMEIPLRLPVSAFRSIAIGDVVRMATDGPEPAVWSGRLVRMAPEADASARTLTAYVEVAQDPSDPDLLHPGQFVVGSVTGEADGPLVVVPRRAVESDRVLVARPEPPDAEAGARVASTVVPRPVRVAYYASGVLDDIDPDETEWAVLAPGSLEPGDVVIVSNLEQLRAGMIVETRDVRDGFDGARAGGGG